MKKKHVLCACMALLLFTVISLFMGWLLMPQRTQYGSTWDSFLQEEENSLDIVFFGSSIAYCDIIPATIWEESGLTSYVMGGPEQTIPLTYYYIREVCNTQKPKMVVLELSAMFFGKYENYTKVNVGYMPIGFNKLSATFNASEKEERFGLLFPLYNYHYRWKEITLDSISDRLSNEKDIYAGYTMLTDSCGIPEIGVRSYSTDTDAYRYNLSYLKKIKEYCDKKKMDLMLYIGPMEISCSEDAIKTLKNDCAKIGTNVADLRSLSGVIGIDNSRDWFDFLHFNIYGAEKFSRYMCSYFKDIVPYKQNDGQIELWNKRVDKINGILGK